MYNLFLFGIHQPSQTHKKTPDYVALRSTVLQIRLSFFLCPPFPASKNFILHRSHYYHNINESSKNHSHLIYLFHHSSLISFLLQYQPSARHRKRKGFAIPNRNLSCTLILPPSYVHYIISIVSQLFSSWFFLKQKTIIFFFVHLGISSFEFEFISLLDIFLFHQNKLYQMRSKKVAKYWRSRLIGIYIYI